MKPLLNIVLFAACLTQMQCKGESLYKKVRFNVKVQDDKNAPIADADARIVYGHYVDSKSVSHEGKTTADGFFTAEDTVISDTALWVKKAGHYPIRLDSLQMAVDEPLRQRSTINLNLTMRPIVKPIPLHGRVVKRALPEQNLPIGYDLQAADWVKPHGKGTVTDMLLSYNKEHLGCKNGERYEEIISRLVKRHEATPRAKVNFLGAVSQFHENNISYDYLQAVQHTAGHWRGTITITFSNLKEGIREVKNEFKHYSELTMPHQAPSDGYQIEWKRSEDNGTPRQTNDRVGYFLRTRVKLDESGEIVSAHYAKLVTDFDFDPRGRITFSYLFNPTANDRNLEFDPKKNLFKKLEIGEEIQKP